MAAAPSLISFAHKLPSWAIRLAGVSYSATRPPSITMMRSESAMVLSRWAMVMTVQSLQPARKKRREEKTKEEKRREEKRREEKREKL